MRKSPCQRRGFSLIELLIVIAIIAVLIAIFLPAAQKIRQSADRTKCQSNMQQLAAAVQAFNTDHNCIPVYYGMQVSPMAANAQINSTNGAGPVGGWFVHLLPYVDQNGAYQAVAASTNAVLQMEMGKYPNPSTSTPGSSTPGSGGAGGGGSGPPSANALNATWTTLNGGSFYQSPGSPGSVVGGTQETVTTTTTTGSPLEAATGHYTGGNGTTQTTTTTITVGGTVIPGTPNSGFTPVGYGISGLGGGGGGGGGGGSSPTTTPGSGGSGSPGSPGSSSASINPYNPNNVNVRDGLYKILHCPSDPSAPANGLVAPSSTTWTDGWAYTNYLANFNAWTCSQTVHPPTPTYAGIVGDYVSQSTDPGFGQFWQADGVAPGTAATPTPTPTTGYNQSTPTPPVRLTDIVDGTQTTIMFGEGYAVCGNPVTYRAAVLPFQYGQQGSSINHYFGVDWVGYANTRMFQVAPTANSNGTTGCNSFAAQSGHPVGMNVAMFDGSVRFIRGGVNNNETYQITGGISQGTWNRLMSWNDTTQPFGGPPGNDW
jgi:prepilin-type N-terminal cleavage/methylation domain-containing protein/prepilin-type processing-associated H-X9-DG protein